MSLKPTITRVSACFHLRDMEDVPEGARASAAVRGCCGRRSVSGDAADPLAFLVCHPDSGIFQFARFIVEIHLEHGRPALAGQGKRHLAREQPAVVAVGPTRCNWGDSARQARIW